MSVLTFLLAPSTSSASITCSGNNQVVSATVPSVITVEGVCTFPVGGCSSLSVGGDLMSWAPTPIVGKYKNALDLRKEIKIGATFRGLENMIGETGSATRTFTQEIKCISNATGATETQQFNIIVNMSKSSSSALALKPPSYIPVGCLIEGEETKVIAKFEKSNASTFFHPLTGTWKKGDDISWVESRPAYAIRTSSNSEHNFDAGSQPVLQSLMPVGDGSSLELVLKPPTAQGFLDGTRDVAWKVCITPGDAFDYFPELCTETFPVRKNRAACDIATTPPPTSDSAMLGSPSGLQVALFVSWFLVYRSWVM